MKKGSKLTLIGAATLMLLPIVGCGHSGNDDGHKILFWSTFNDDYQATINEAKRRFETKYPEYKISIPKQTGTYTDLANMVKKGASTGNYPDLVALYPDNAAEFISLGISLDIDQYINDPSIGWTTDDFDDIPEDYIVEGRQYIVQGTYSLPFCKSTEVMFYNRKLVGIELHDDEINDGNALDDNYLQNLTWEELFNKLCPALVEYNDSLPDDQKIMKPATDKKKTYVVGYHSDDNLFITLCQQLGLPYTSIKDFKGSIDWAIKNNKKEFVGVDSAYIEMLKPFIDAYKKGYFVTTGANGSSASYYFTGGGMLFCIGSTGGVKYCYDSTNANDVGVAKLPHFEETINNNYLINQGPSVAFLRRGEKDSEVQRNRARGAWLFYKEFTSLDLNVQWAVNTGYAPIRKRVASDPAFVAASDPTTQPDKSQAKLEAYTRGYTADHIGDLFSTAVFYGSGKVRSAVESIISQGLKLDPEAATFVDDLTALFRSAYNSAI